MSVPLSAAAVLGEHVTFELECIDRMYCNAYVRKLTYRAGVASFFTHHRGATFASTCLADPISEQFVASIQRFAAEREIPVVRFEKGQRKDDVAHEHLARFTDEEGIYMVGVAQEKIGTFRAEKRRKPADGRHDPWIVSASALVNQYYMYGLDVEFGPFFLKFSSYFPYGAKLCFNGHHWAQRQAQAAGIAFTALDNGFLECDDPGALQRICHRLSAAKIDAFFRQWLARLPHPFTGKDRRAGYRYELSILQAEFSLTQMLDRPHPGRGVLRAAHPRQPRSRPARQGQPDLRPPSPRARPPAHPVEVAHPAAHPRGHPLDPRRLQAQQDQAVPQAPESDQNRDHDQRHPGLRDRQTAEEPARAAAGRLPSQPASFGHSTARPRPDRRRPGAPSGQ
jgi:hypothetical protein